MTNSSTTTSIVFFGTGEVSLETLKSISGKITVEAVITKPDLMASSGRAMSPAVKIWAESNSIPCYQPANKAELAELCAQTKFSSKAGLVVDYGIIIPLSVITGFEKGILNSHFSLLPRWRGADPITWSILAGDQTTGVTVMQVDEGMDTGDILAVEEIEVASDETVPTLTDKLVRLSNSMLIDVIPKYLRGEITPAQQNHTLATFSKKIQKEDGLLKPSEYTATELERQIRAYLGWPGSYMTSHGALLAIKKVGVSEVTAPTGQLVQNEGRLLLGCKEGSLEIELIQPAGKKPMDARSFANGYANLLN